MIAEAWEVLEESLTIVAFVALTLLAIEYFNVVSRGSWMRRLTSGRLTQYLLCGALGAMPGCVGGFAVVSLYSHKRVSLGAVVACMIAACGDEAFVMLALFPGRAVAMLCGLFALGVVVGMAADAVAARIAARRSPGPAAPDCDFKTHEHEVEDAASLKGRFSEQWRKPSAIRAILTCTIACFVLLLVADQFDLLGGGHSDAGAHGHGHGGGINFEWASLVVFSVVGLFIVATVSDHFLEEHLWGHVLKTHVPRIFLWTVGALGAIAVLQHFVDVRALIAGNTYVILLVAVAIGVIPQSGPHLIFTTLFAAGALPFGILVANSVVQDGHGMLPMLAYSRRHFIIIKSVDACVALVVGAAMLAAGM
jgi:hypothetical protein